MYLLTNVLAVACIKVFTTGNEVQILFGKNREGVWAHKTRSVCLLTIPGAWWGKGGELTCPNGTSSHTWGLVGERRGIDMS